MADRVVADAKGVASFDLLPGRAREKQAFVWAFDLLELDGEDVPDLPLERRKSELKIEVAPSIARPRGGNFQRGRCG